MQPGRALSSWACMSRGHLNAYRLVEGEPQGFYAFAKTTLVEGVERDTQHFTLHLASPCKEMRVHLPLAKLGGGRQTGAALLLLLCDNGELIVNVCLVLGRRSLVGFRKEGPE